MKSMQGWDEEPRYIISKLDQLNQQDLVQTNKDNLVEEDRLNGSGDALGNELNQMLKENEEAKERIRKERLEFKSRTLYNLMKENSATFDGTSNGHTELKKIESDQDYDDLFRESKAKRADRN